MRPHINFTLLDVNEKGGKKKKKNEENRDVCHVVKGPIPHGVGTSCLHELFVFV